MTKKTTKKPATKKSPAKPKAKKVDAVPDQDGKPDDELLSIGDVAREMGVDPKAARAVLPTASATRRSSEAATSTPL